MPVDSSWQTREWAANWPGQSVFNATVDTFDAEPGRILSVLIHNWQDPVAFTSIRLDPDGDDVPVNIELDEAGPDPWSSRFAIVTFAIPDTMSGSQTLRLTFAANTFNVFAHCRVLQYYDPDPVSVASQWNGGSALSLGTLAVDDNVAIVGTASNSGVTFNSPETLDTTELVHPGNTFNINVLGLNDALTSAGTWSVTTNGWAEKFGVVYRYLGPGPDEQDLLPPLLTNTHSFPAATVTPGAVSIAPPLVVNGHAFPSATVTVGPVAIQPPLLVNEHGFPPATITNEGAPQSIYPPLLVREHAFPPASVVNEGEPQPEPVTGGAGGFYDFEGDYRRKAKRQQDRRDTIAKAARRVRGEDDKPKSAPPAATVSPAPEQRRPPVAEVAPGAIPDFSGVAAALDEMTSALDMADAMRLQMAQEDEEAAVLLLLAS